MERIRRRGANKVEEGRLCVADGAEDSRPAATGSGVGILTRLEVVVSGGISETGHHPVELVRKRGRRPAHAGRRRLMRLSS